MDDESESYSRWYYVGILLIIILIIIIIVVPIVIVSNEPKDECKSTADCGAHQVCTRDDLLGFNVCKSSIDGPCKDSLECIPGLFCFNGTCQGGRTGFTGNTGTTGTTGTTGNANFGFMQEWTRNYINPAGLPPLNRQNMFMGGLAKPAEITMAQTDESSVIFTSMRPKRRYQTTSVDIETNSEGLSTDASFDVGSQSSEVRRSPRVSPDISWTRPFEETQSKQPGVISSPCFEYDGTYSCKNDDHGAGVIDVCSYSRYTLFLFDDGDIVMQEDKNRDSRRRKISNISLKFIIAYDGYLYGASDDGTFYTLPNKYLEHENWTWKRVDWIDIDSISHISGSQDRKCLWLQTNTHGYLCKEEVVEQYEFPSYIRRIYGRDVNNYVEINSRTHTAIIYPKQDRYSDIYDAALSYHNELAVITKAESKKYKRVTIVNWDPYFIKQ